MRTLNFMTSITAGVMLSSTCLAQARVPQADSHVDLAAQLRNLNMVNSMTPISTSLCPAKGKTLNVIRLHIKADALMTSTANYCAQCFGVLKALTKDAAGTVAYQGPEVPQASVASKFSIDDYSTPWDFDIKNTPTLVEIILDGPNTAFWHPFVGGGSASDVIDVDTSHWQYFGCLRQISDRVVSFYVKGTLPYQETVPAGININILLGLPPTQLPIAIDPHPTNNG